jgi:hypothetical protein
MIKMDTFSRVDQITIDIFCDCIPANKWLLSKNVTARSPKKSACDAKNCLTGFRGNFPNRPECREKQPVSTRNGV